MATGEDFRQRLAEFAADLRILRVEHGGLSLREIERRSPRQRRLSVSAVSETLNGKRLPRLDFLMALVRTLLAHDEEGRPRPLDRDDPRAERWRERWRDLELLRMARRAADADSSGDVTHRAPAQTARVDRRMSTSVHRSSPAGSLAQCYDAAGVPFIGHSVTAVAFAPDGRLLAAASDDGTMRLWDLPTGRAVLAPGTGHTDGVRAVAFHPDGRIIATAGRDRTIRRWKSTGEPIGDPLTGHTAGLDTVAFSPDGRVLASASMDRTVRLWDPATGLPIGTPLTGHTGGVEAVAFSPDGRVLASASMDRTVRLWDPATGLLVGTPLTGHTNSVRSVAFSPDGRLLATAGMDGTARLWDPATGRPAGAPLTGHTGPVKAVAFSPDGRLLATAGADKTTRLWKKR